jgi:hypothetical protein
LADKKLRDMALALEHFAKDTTTNEQPKSKSPFTRNRKSKK